MSIVLRSKSEFASGEFEEFGKIIEEINSSDSCLGRYRLNCFHTVTEAVLKILLELEQGLKQEKTCPICESPVVIAFSDSAMKKVVKKIFHKKKYIPLPPEIFEMQSRVQAGVSFMPGYSARFKRVGSLEEALTSRKIVFESESEDSIFSRVSFSSIKKSLKLEVTFRKEPSEKERKEVMEWLEGSDCSLISNSNATASIVAKGLKQVRALRDRLLENNFFPEEELIKMRRIINAGGDWDLVENRSAAARREGEEGSCVKKFLEEEERLHRENVSKLGEIFEESIRDLEALSWKKFAEEEGLDPEDVLRLKKIFEQSIGFKKSLRE